MRDNPLFYTNPSSLKLFLPQALSILLIICSAHSHPLPFLVAHDREASRARAQGTRRGCMSVVMCGLTWCGFRTISRPSRIRFARFSNCWIREDESYAYTPIKWHSSVWIRAWVTHDNERWSIPEGKSTFWLESLRVCAGDWTVDWAGERENG